MAARKKAPPEQASFVFVSGSDEAEVKKTAAALAVRMAPSDDPFATETIDGAVANVEEAVARIHATIEALLTVGFFGGAKLVWLKSASFFADTVTGRSETVAQAIAKLLAVLEAGVPPGVRLLISAPEPDKRRAAFKQLSKLGNAVICDKPDFGWGATEADVIAWVSHRAREAGMKLKDEAIEVLAARTGAETRQLDSELEKLSLAFDSAHQITAQDIRDLVPATRTGIIFDLGHAVAKRDLPLCLASLKQLLYQGERGIGILLAAIVPTVRNLLVVKDLLETYKLPAPAQPQFFASTLKRIPEENSTHLPRKKDGSVNAFALGLAAVNCRNYALGELERALLACSRANLDLVTTQLSEETILARLLIEVVARR